MSQVAFYFDSNLCTGCAACAIACQIENQRLPVDENPAVQPWRSIYSYNTTHTPGLPAFHLSLACNHCLEPACQAACPSNAYTKDSLTGAVLIDQKRCIGCGYCAWACPFDAPKFNHNKGVMEKCTFCLPRLVKGEQPACSGACPTGTLQIGLLEDNNADLPSRSVSVLPSTQKIISDTSTAGTAWMPGLPRTTLKPAVRFIPLRNLETLLNNQVPATPSTTRNFPKISFRSEWPLWVLTGIFPLLFAWFASRPAWQHAGLPWLDAGMLGLGGLTMLVSTLHLGKPLRAWRAILNPNTSWLSREILLVTAFLTFAAGMFGIMRLGNTTDFLNQSSGLIQSSLLVIGLLALYAIDRVYDVLRLRSSPVEEMYRPRMRLHSAWTIFSGLYLAGITALADTQTNGSPIQMLLIMAGMLCGIVQLCLYAARHAPAEASTSRQAIWRSARVILGFFLPFACISAATAVWLPLSCAALGMLLDRAEFYNDLLVVTPGW